MYLIVGTLLTLVSRDTQREHRFIWVGFLVGYPSHGFFRDSPKDHHLLSFFGLGAGLTHGMHSAHPSGPLRRSPSPFPGRRLAQCANARRAARGPCAAAVVGHRPTAPT